MFDGIVYFDYYIKLVFFEFLKCIKFELEDYCVVKGNKFWYDGVVLIWGMVDFDVC